MVDREKVIKALEVCSSISDGEECPKECPYRGQDMYCIGSAGLMLDALDLLKEQEAVKPIKKDTVEITARYEFDCQCGAPLLIGQPYCANCGRSVKWDG